MVWEPAAAAGGLLELYATKWEGSRCAILVVASFGEHVQLPPLQEQTGNVQDCYCPPQHHKQPGVASE
ncbi:hypothetical protein cyc_07779 [Cyclospora cayetanensis]|uniref:Uncharacterized protein n=1 Tax=Cyclospora cayetanensis TaxID=88456 RepID=A0A1D3D030_9EIME|nr:hypothetical protein cyc_07779 [Cyclospora cayetanensis]